MGAPLKARMAAIKYPRGCLAYALDNFEVPFKLPIGHRVLKLSPFPFARGCEVFDKGVAEKISCEFRLLEYGGSAFQRARQALDIFRAAIFAFDRRDG